MPTKSLTRSQPQKSSATSVPGYRVDRGVPLPLGATLRRTGANFAIFSKHATSCTLVLLQPGAEHPFVEYPLDPHSNRTGQVWHAFVEGLDAGMQYGYRFDMQPNPNPVVHRFNPSHVLLDPYARVLSHGGAWGQYPAGKRPYRNSVVVENHFDWGDDQPLNIPLVTASFTRRTSAASPNIRPPGSRIAGPTRDSSRRFPTSRQLGVTAVELLPVNEFEEGDTDRVNPFTGERLLNLWGYQPTAFCAPNAAYSSNRADGEQVREFKQMVRALHQAGIEVILDMVFNHTAEGDEHGPDVVVPRHR